MNGGKEAKYRKLKHEFSGWCIKHHIVKIAVSIKYLVDEVLQIEP